MSEVLSQSEIDALLFAVSSGSVDTAPLSSNPQQKEDWIAYDLTSQEKIYHGKLVGLEGIHDRFARLFRVTLSNYFKKNITIKVTNTDYLKFGDYVGNIVLPTSLNLFVMPKLQGHMLFIVTSKLLYALVDAYYGGIERPFAKLGTREEFTSIENNMIRKICSMAVDDIKEAWRLNYNLDVSYSRMEANPAFIGAIHASDLVAVVTFDLEFENLSGPFNLVLQLRALDPIQHHLSVNVTTEFDKEVGYWRDHWLREIAQTQLQVRAELGRADKNVKDVQSWKVGDEIALMQDSSSPVQVFIEEVPKLQGLMGVYKGNVAVRLVDGDSDIEQGG